ncbi:lipopolysaccharide biosynthesis protein [Neobacillus sp. 179-J 1A1 HS]|uniref:lipopolysaccharide biosynthesis protein n=1 Tax=Neobacillus driksii TaxID=3035913 RepID=UPI0035BBBA7B
MESKSLNQAKRVNKIRYTMLAAALQKGISVLIPLITVRVSLDYLGVEMYGMWTTVTSFFAVFAYADLGLGYALQTRLSQATAFDNRDNQYQKLISSAHFMVLGISGLLTIIFLLVFPFVKWDQLINANSEGARVLVGVVVLGVVLSKFLDMNAALIQRTQLALQEGYKYYLWQSAGNILSLLSIFTVAHLDLGKVLLVWVSAFIPVCISFGNMLYYYGKERRELLPKKRWVQIDVVRAMLRTGSIFLLLSFLVAIGNSLDNWVVAQIRGLSDVTSFSIINKIAILVQSVVLILGTPLWSANGEAFARGDVAWIRKNTKKTSLIMTGLTLFGSVLILLSFDTLIQLWLGRSLETSYTLLIGMLTMQILLAFINPYFMVLNGAGVVKPQLWIYGIYTPIVIFLKFLIGKNLGVEAIPWVGVICYMLFVIPPTIILTNYTLNKKNRAPY